MLKVDKVLKVLLCSVFLNFVIGSNVTELDEFDELDDDVNERSPRYFPFHTLGRFEQTVCIGRNSLIGTCVLKGQCNEIGGTQTGTAACSAAISKQARCCTLTQSCGTSTNFNNTYFVNSGYPSTFGGGSICNMVVTRPGSDVCQLRVDFLDFDLAQPTGNGQCFYDYFQVTGGRSFVPRICGKNMGQHVYVNFNGDTPLTVTVATSSAFTYNRRWNLQLQMVGCDSLAKAPDGCLQYWQEASKTISSFNYDTTGSGLLNAIGVQGTRQIWNLYYGACVRPQPSVCSITWTRAPNDPYSFTVTGDVGSVPIATLGSAALQQTACTTDFVVIPAASQQVAISAGGTITAGDRFCGLGFQNTTSNVLPFVIYSRTDGNETPDIGNRGWSLTYTQNMCAV